jgi:hypothetical protein
MLTSLVAEEETFGSSLVNSLHTLYAASRRIQYMLSNIL